MHSLLLRHANMSSGHPGGVVGLALSVRVGASVGVAALDVTAAVVVRLVSMLGGESELSWTHTRFDVSVGGSISCMPFKHCAVTSNLHSRFDVGVGALDW